MNCHIAHCIYDGALEAPFEAVVTQQLPRCRYKHQVAGLNVRTPPWYFNIQHILKAANSIALIVVLPAGICRRGASGSIKQVEYMSGK